MKHLLTLNDWTGDEILALLDLADYVKAQPDRWRTTLAGKSLAMIFEKSSTRTRVSFEVGMLQLGGNALFLSRNDLQLGRGETIPDTAKVLSRYVDGIMARVYEQSTVEELAQGTVPVINGLSDRYHPCQALADLQTIRERQGCLRDVVLTYVGDGNNVAHSLMIAGAKVGAEVRIAHPEGYAPAPEIVDICRDSPGSVELFTNPQAAVTDASVVYTDVWTSMGMEGQEDKREAVFHPFQVNLPLFELARPDAIFMHCLPAHRGHEVTDEVVDHERSVVLDEAENRLHAQKALLMHLLGGISLGT